MAAQTVLPVLVVTMWKQNLSAFSTTSHLFMQNPTLTAPQHSEEMAEPFAFARNNWEIMELLFAFPIKRSSRTTSTYWEGCIDSSGSRMEVFRSAALGSSGEMEHGALRKLFSISLAIFSTSKGTTQRYLNPSVTKSAQFTEVGEDCLTNIHSLQTTSQF